MKIVAVVQARKGSSRLPGKILLPVGGEPLLYRMLERLERAKTIDEIWVASTKESEDKEILSLSKRWGFRSYAGHAHDLLDRHYQVALKSQADVILKIPSDVPLISPSIIDRVVQFYCDGDFDFVSNLHPATYPDGNDVECIRFETLEAAWAEAKKDYEREHTTPFIWENPKRFRIGNVTWESGLDYSMSHRWTIDYKEDYLFIKRVFEELYPKNPEFEFKDILNLLKLRPDISRLNQKFNGVNWYRHHLDDLKTVTEKQTRKISKKKKKEKPANAQPVSS